VLLNLRLLIVIFEYGKYYYQLKDKAEFELLKQLLSKMNVTSKVISEEDQKYIGLAILVK
jgi:hypothetical protein